MLKKITKGNDIFIKWNIFKNANLLFNNPTVLLYDSFKKKCPFTYEIEDKGTSLFINGKYLGKDQKTMGLYHLVFYNNYGDENQTSLVYRNGFILVHALKNGLSSFGDSDADEAILVELDSDLSVELWDRTITDKEDVILALSQISLVNDNLNIKLNDISTHLDSSLLELSDRIDNFEIDSIDTLIQNIEDAEEVITRYLVISDTSINNNKANIDILSYNINGVSTNINTLNNRLQNVSSNIINVSTQINNVSSRVSLLATEISEAISYDDTSLIETIDDISSNLQDFSIAWSDNLQAMNQDVNNVSTRVKDVSTYAKNVSTRLDDLSTYAHNITPGTDFDDSLLKLRMADVSQYSINVSSKLDNVSTRLDDLSTYAHNITPGTDFDDTEIKSRLNDVSTKANNVSTQLQDLSTYTHNLVIPNEYDDTEIKNKVDDLSTYAHNINIPNEYDDTVIKSRIADVSQYSINVSSKLDDLSTYTHNITIPEAYDDTDIKSRIADVSLYGINVSTSLLDVSTRLNLVKLSMLEIDTKIDDVSLRLSQGGGADLTDVNSSISDLSTRMQTLEGGTISGDFNNYSLYTRYDLIYSDLLILDSSSVLFHDVIFDVSSIKSGTGNSTYDIRLHDVVNDNDASIKLTCLNYNIITLNCNDANTKINILNDGVHIGNTFRGLTGNFYAYHFPHLMKIKSESSNVSEKRNVLYFRFEDEFYIRKNIYDSDSSKYLKSNYTYIRDIIPEMINTSLVEFRDIVILFPYLNLHFNEEEQSFSSEDIYNFTINFQNVLTGTVDSSIALIGYTLNNRERLGLFYLNGVKTSINLEGELLSGIFESYNSSTYWKDFPLESTYYYRFPSTMRIYSINNDSSIRTFNTPNAGANMSKSILFRLEN